MRVKEIMREPAVTVSTQSTLAEAIDRLVEHGISGLAVLDPSQRLCGILSEGDMLRRLELGTEAPAAGWWSVFTTAPGPAEAFRRANSRWVTDVMSPSPVSIDEEASLSDAAALMEKHRFRRLPVTRAGTLVGMVTRSDFVRALRPLVTPAFTRAAVSDADIRESILAALLKQSWAASCGIDVTVTAGHVLLEGGVANDDQRRAARVAAENVPGVRSVQERLQFYEAVVVPGF